MGLTLTAEPQINRRQHSRWVLPTGCASLSIRRMGGGGCDLHGPVRDISWGGVRFELDGSLEAGEEVEVEVEIEPEHKKLLRATGRVVRFISADERCPTQLAVTFTRVRNPADADQLTRSLRDALSPPGPRAA